MTPEAVALGDRIREVVSIDAGANAIEFDRRWYTWGELAATIDAVGGHVSPGDEVGILLRNTPGSVGLLLGVLAAGGCAVTINPGRGVVRTRDDVASLSIAAIAGSADDVAMFVSDDVGATRLELDDLGGDLVVSSESGGDRPSGDGTVAVRMLTSGTTGPPKRVELTYRMLDRVLRGAKHYERAGEEAPRLRDGVALVNSPLVHLGGLFRVLMCVRDGRSFELLPRFTVDGWVDAVRRHRPATSTLVPTALRMVLAADVDPDDLASLRSVVSGTAPLDPDDADAFTARFGAPVLVSYAATEFGGGVAGWTVADHREFWAAKRGSVGRAHPGCELRVVDPVTGGEVPTGDDGVLEVRAHQLETADWVRTTDLARIDDDGFLYILGRADQAIVRGGFKVLPDDVRLAIERHPDVAGAAVLGRDDARLGQVPVAAVETRNGAVVTDAELLDFLRPSLAAYELPAAILVADPLPRTESGKVDLGAVAAMFDGSDPAPAEAVS